jgi:predicted phage-related endonuclease
MVGKLTPDDIATASTLPAIMGMSRYKTPNDALRDAIDAMEGTREDTWTGNEATRWGDRLEGTIITEAAHRLGLNDLCLEFPKAFFHSSLPLACSLDGSAVGEGVITTSVERGIYCMNADRIDLSGTGIIESKLTSAAPEDVPPPFRGPWQLQAQMMCTGHKWGVVATFYRGIELRLFVYQADEGMQKRITAAVHEFEDRKRNRDWYPVASSDDADRAYARVDDGAPDIDLSSFPDGDRMLAELVEAKEAKAAAESRIDDAQAAIKEIMGSHEGARGLVGNNAYRVAWPERNYKAQPEKVVPAKEAYTKRAATLTVRALD